jgi:hypothetical protein
VRGWSTPQLRRKRAPEHLTIGGEDKRDVQRDAFGMLVAQDHRFGLLKLADEAPAPTAIARPLLRGVRRPLRRVHKRRDVDVPARVRKQAGRVVSLDVVGGQRLMYGAQALAKIRRRSVLSDPRERAVEERHGHQWKRVGDHAPPPVRRARLRSISRSLLAA